MEKKTILIVDEEEKNIKLMKAMLKSENYHLFSVLSGTDCMKMVMDISPDLILLDILISNMGGFDICRRLKQEEKTRKIPIVMASMLTEKKHRIKGIKAGADDFLGKPVDKTELLVRVKSLLRMKSYHDALNESEAKYRTVLESNPDPVVLYDMEGKVKYFNPAFTNVFGWTLDERIGKKMDEFVPDENWPETRMMIDKVLAGESFSGIETCRYTKKGDIISTSISGSIYRNEDNRPLGSVINLRGISEQKKLEAQLHQSIRMKAAYTLAGGIAHDFNNLLMGIQGRASLIKMDIDSSHPYFKHIRRIEEFVESAADLTKQLLDFAKGRQIRNQNS